MKMACPVCNREITAANLNMEKGMALCAACGGVFTLAELTAAPAPQMPGPAPQAAPAETATVINFAQAPAQYPPAQAPQMPQAPAQPPYQAPPPYQNAPAPQYRQMPGQAPVAAARKSAIALLVFSILSVLFWGLLFFLNPSDTDIMNLCLIIWGFFYGVFALIQSAKCKKLLPLVLSSSEISFSLLIFVATVYFGEWVDNFFLLVFFLFSAAFVLVILIWSIRQITRRPIWQ